MMIEGIGTTWMRPEPEGRPDEQKRVEEMGLGELRPLMCPKSAGIYETCVKCKGVSKCPVGQRINVLLMEEEARKAHLTLVAATTDEDRELFRKSCESGNAWVYLMENQGLGKDAAGELLSRLIKKYPGIAADFGGGRRIMQRPRVVKPVELRVAQEEASETKAEEMDTREEEVPYEANNGPELSKQQMGGAVIRERARESARIAFESGDPIAYLIQMEGKDRTSARQKVDRWMRAYPDLVGDYKLPESMRGRVKRKTKEQPKEEPMEDEITLEDFLNGFEEEPEKPAGDTVQDALTAKYDELTVEKDRIQADILRAEERLKSIEDEQAALEKVLSIFKRR